MTAQQLKNSILQMAVQGKLVPQDPNDEPVSVLLERIRAEKEQLIKQKKIKREKNPSYIFRGADNTPYEKIGNNEPVSIADEVPFEIPDAWEWVRLGTISTYAETKQKVNAQNADPSIWGLDLEDIEKGGRLISCKTVGERKAVGDKTVFFKGDILYSKLRPYLLKILVAPDDGICTPEIVPFRVYGEIASEYIVYFLKSPYVDTLINTVTYGVKMPRVGTETMVSLFVPIPPLKEQYRIIEKLHELEPYVEQYAATCSENEALNAAFPTELKKSILQMAVQGKLVPQDPADEPASVLLERIRAEKQQLIAEGKIKRDKHESVIFRRDNSHYEKCGSVETCIDDIIPFEVPGNWIWVRLGTLIEEKPSNGYSPKGVPYSTNVKNLTLSATTSGYFKSDAYKYVDIEIPSDSKYWLKHNDILIQRSNSRELVGTACIYTGKDNEFIYPDLMMRIRAMNRIDIRYLDLVLKAPFSRRYFTSSASGTSDSMPKINQTIVTNTFVPLPPIEEQRRITAFVDKLFSCLTF